MRRLRMPCPWLDGTEAFVGFKGLARPLLDGVVQTQDASTWKALEGGDPASSARAEVSLATQPFLSAPPTITEVAGP